MTLKNFLSGLTIVDDGRMYVKKTDAGYDVYLAAEPSDALFRGDAETSFFCISGNISISDVNVLHGYKKIASFPLSDLPMYGGYALAGFPCAVEMKPMKDGRTEFAGGQIKGYIDDCEISARKTEENELTEIDDVYWGAVTAAHPEEYEEHTVRLSAATKKYVLKEDGTFYFTKGTADLYDFYLTVYDGDKDSPVGYDIGKAMYVKVTLPAKIRNFRYIILGPDELYENFDLDAVETHSGVGAVEYFGGFKFGKIKRGTVPFGDFSFEGFIEDCDVRIKKIRKSEFCGIERKYNRNAKD
ncbi:MAG: hypothetical protein LUD47_01035 [Clostridia bacterium]|nr:hypothetical protein [Clostridia bacterium]